LDEAAWARGGRYRRTGQMVVALSTTTAVLLVLLISVLGQHG
jgi:hypothetical protein